MAPYLLGLFCFNTIVTVSILGGVWSVLPAYEVNQVFWVWFKHRLFIVQCVHLVLFVLEYFKIFRTLAFLCLPPCQCVYTHQAGRTPAALQQNWKSSEKSQTFKIKTQYLMNTLYEPDYLNILCYEHGRLLLLW